MLKSNQPLHIVAYHKLLHMIRGGRFGAKLPAEKQLAEMLHVSRTTLRQALLILQEDHIVYTKRGSGTYVSTGTHRKRNLGLESYFPIHRIVDAAEPVSSEPASSEVVVSEPVVSIEQTDELAAEHLNIPQSSSLIIVSRSCRLREEVFAYTIDFLPANLLHERMATMMGAFVNFAKVVDEIIPMEVYSAECEIIPTKAGEHISKHLHIGTESPVLLLTQVLRDEKAVPLSLNKTYIDTNKVSIRLLRKTTLER